jgi:hypothetical protein
MKLNLLLAACALLFVVLVTELVLRVTHAFDARVSWTAPDPEIGWRFEPGRAYWFFNENDHAITGRINALGWRDRERDRTKHVGMRVAVLGDSFVEAFQVELDSTFVAIAERNANQRGTRDGRTFEFMNFGRSGMGPVEESIVLRRDVLPCVPDVVVLVCTPSNDVTDVNPATATNVLRPFYVVDARDSLVLDRSFRLTKGYRIRALINPFKQHSALVSLVAERYNASRAGRPVAPAAHETAAVAKLKPEQTLMSAHPDATLLANYALAKRIIAGMAHDCSARGAEFVLMSVPFVYQDAEIARLRVIDASFDPDYFDRDLAAMADTSGFSFVPLTDAFSARWRKTGESLYWAHWNYAGHRLVGGRLADAVWEMPVAP